MCAVCVCACVRACLHRLARIQAGWRASRRALYEMTRIYRGRALGYASFYARKALPDGSPPAKGRSKLVRVGVVCACVRAHSSPPPRARRKSSPGVGP